MPMFAYTARDSSGSPASGTLSADSVAQVIQSLRAEGKYPISVQPADQRDAPGGRMPDRGIKLPRAEVIQIATQLSIMIETGVSLERLDAAIDEVLRGFMEKPIDADHLQRAKTRLIAVAIYAQDSQASLARWYGEALATGLTIEVVVAWPERMEAVTANAVTVAARKWLDKRRAVTGFLLPAVA